MNAALLAVVSFALALVGPLRAQGSARALPRGVTPEVQTAVERGLEWLRREQGQDGSWRDGGESGVYPVAMTGLAGMALVGSGSTPTRGKHWRQVRRSMDYLTKVADPQRGLIHEEGGEASSMHGHGFAMLYLASVYGMEEDVARQKVLHGVLTRGVALIERSQSAAGGWYYRPDSNDDEGSVTVTQVQALRACRMVGIVVDKRTIDRAVDYVKKCQNPDGGICYGLTRRGESRPAITAAGIAVFYNAGVYDDEAFVDRAFRFAKANLDPVRDTTNHHFYAQLYWSQALYQRGGDDWQGYYEKVGAWLVRTQAKDGSWRGADGCGPVYATSIALTVLQLPWALVPIQQR